MLQRSILRRKILSLSSSPPKLSRDSFVVSLFSLIIVAATLSLMSNAQAASCKIPKSYYKNVSCTASSGYFLAIKDFGAPVALINKQGKSVVDLSRYQKVDADKISSGLLPVLRNGHVGYINMQGREVIPAMYDMLKDSQGWARPVSEGRIVVKQNGHYGVIDTANKIIVPFTAAISNIDDYRGGITRVRKNQAISWLDKNGNTTRDPNSSADGQSSTNNTEDNVKDQQKSASSSRFTTLQPHQQDGRWGFVDDHNVTMITYAFDEVRPFSEGLAGVRIDNEWGFVNLGGELVIPFRFSNSGVSVGDRYKNEPAFVFTGGKAWIGNLKNGDKMCIDKEGAGVSCD
ncbi:WG repeat-containing protein [Psychrobacter sp. ANT_WB68]|uniref:WG repeat-containing protein n=1 Tax=Psychrobacter sp. ANT_WB68 TaxID=2597355 RepID=UPI0011F3B3EE|nr:WG repeat-containing protein [Psychrobacter sp. ANT_WB68]KAA0914450.1 WG repeat-containing protein [Psychrobacter sp. ANT_WB68]